MCADLIGTRDSAPTESPTLVRISMPNCFASPPSPRRSFSCDESTCNSALGVGNRLKSSFDKKGPLNFSFFLPTRLYFGYGSLDILRKEAESLGGPRALIITDKVMVKTGIIGRVEENLLKADVEVFDGVQPEPSIDVAQEVADKVRSRDFNLVVGVGGGSSMDMAKVAAGFGTNKGDAKDYVGNNKFVNASVPSIMIPTTAGTGAEITVTSMVTVEGHKQWINSPLLLP